MNVPTLLREAGLSELDILAIYDGYEGIVWSDRFESYTKADFEYVVDILRKAILVLEGRYPAWDKDLLDISSCSLIAKKSQIAIALMNFEDEAIRLLPLASD